MSSSEIEKKKRALPRAPATGPRRAPPQLDEAGCAGVASVRGRRRVFVGGCWGGTAGANAAVTGAAESFRLTFFRAHMHGVCRWSSLRLQSIVPDSAPRCAEPQSPQTIDITKKKKKPNGRSPKPDKTTMQQCIQKQVPVRPPPVKVSPV